MSHKSATPDRVHTVAERIKILGLEKFAEELRKKREVESILSILKRLPTDCSQEFKNTVSVRISKKLEAYREACRCRTRSAFCAGDFSEELDDLMSKKYYRWSRDSKEVVECNFCSTRLDIDANTKYRTTQAIFDLKGACVECQPKLLDGVQTCIHPRDICESNGRYYSMESGRRNKCNWCYHRGHPITSIRMLISGCKVSEEEEMTPIINAFKQAWELKKFKGELTIVLVAKDLKGLSPIEFAEKYGFDKL
jgi:hypothetical protein